MRAFLLVTALVLPIASCICPIEAPTVEVAADGRPIFRWASGGVARLCVTEAGIDCPPGRNDKMPAGQKAHWFVSARGGPCFPGGIKPPVVYGLADQSNCMFDETADNGGVAGGLPLEKGKRYRLGLAGFGGDPVYSEFVAP
jgi:hypothetical protein